jgi:uncharacterized membrane protein
MNNAEKDPTGTGESSMSLSSTDPLRHHRAHRGKGAFGEGFVPRMAEKVAEMMGTVQFVLISTVVIIAWMVVNHVGTFLADSYHGLLKGTGFDPAPFILLNLVFSAVAYYSASMVMIAQKTQAKREGTREEADAKHREELAQEFLTLLQENTDLTEQVKRNTDLLEEIHKHITALTPEAGDMPA